MLSLKTPPIIDNFVGRYHFLSNFYASPIMHQDILYPTNEHLYQAMKTKDIEKRFQCSIINTPGEAKKFGRNLKLRKDWEEIKDKVMLYGVRRKFLIKPLRIALINTEDAKLIERNWWNDKYWGVCKGEGKNKLGKILMRVRKELQ